MEDAGYRAVSVVPSLEGGRSAAKIVLENATGTKTVSEGLDQEELEATMKWVTRKRIHVNRTATGWLISRFLDPRAEILFLYDSLYAHLKHVPSK